jgi:hypothetical protein
MNEYLSKRRGTSHPKIYCHIPEVLTFTLTVSELVSKFCAWRGTQSLAKDGKRKLSEEALGDENKFTQSDAGSNYGKEAYLSKRRSWSELRHVLDTAVKCSLCLNDFHNTMH